MTGPVFTWLHCSVCGKKIAKRPGVQVVQGIICDDPTCEYQGPAPTNLQRDAYIVAAVTEGVSVSQVAFANEMSRQRVYQIMESWKVGV